MTTVNRAIANSVADAIDYFPFAYDERQEIVSLLRQAQDVLFRSWDRLTDSQPHMKDVGLWPYLASLKDANNK